MPTLHLICGLPCAGKTTLARQLEQTHHALRLTPDEWHMRLFGNDIGDPAHDERHTAVEAALWEIAVRVLALGVDVILDFGFWSRAERDDYRARAALLGATSRLHALIVPEETLLARLAQRNARLPPATFRISPGELKQWVALFEPPTAAELGAHTAAPEQRPESVPPAHQDSKIQ